MNKHVLITGVSTGIGLSLAQAFIARGHRVWGTVRTEDSLPAPLAHAPLFSKVFMDVTNEVSIRNAFVQVAQESNSRLDILINNAGIAVSGPLAYLPIERVEEQFNVNVFGLLRVTQAFVPLLRRESDALKPSLVINVSSISGLMTRPMMGPYSASKFAVESLSDALRMELHSLGIRVVIIQPGAMKTPIWEKAKSAEPRFQNTPYAKMFRAENRLIRRFEKIAIPVERVVAVVLKAAAAKKPRHRYLVTAYKPLVLIFSKWLPTWISDKLYLREIKLLEQST
jgi:NAD(P)-dependent dehydrogenase (short-subunit alcohol dehydrogenase family)